MSRICIIGGAGFIGTHLIKVLEDDHQIVVIDKKLISPFTENITYIHCDIRHGKELLNKFPDNIDVVIHLAAEHADNVYPVSLYYDVNVTGTSNILNVLSEKKINKLIFTSTVAVYGINKINPDESAATDPFNHYGKSKFKAEELIRNWYQSSSNHRSLTIIRPTVVFGSGNKGNVYNLLMQVSSGKFMMIGSGKNKKSMAYVGNVVEFIKYSINHISGYHIYNYIDKPDLSTKELIVLVENALNTNILPIRIPYFIGYTGAVFLDFLSKFTNLKFSITAVRVKKFCATTQFSTVNIKNTDFVAPFDLQTALELTIKEIVNVKTKKEILEYSSE